MLAAFARVAKTPRRLVANVVMSCTVDEGVHRDGRQPARQVVERGGGLPTPPRASDAAIIAEPTDLDVVVATAGDPLEDRHARPRSP